MADKENKEKVIKWIKKKTDAGENPWITKKKKKTEAYITKKSDSEAGGSKAKEAYIAKKNTPSPKYITKKTNKAKGGRVGLADGGRTNLLEELGRVKAEPSNANRRAEISRVHGELNKGYKTGGRVGFKHGSGRPKGGWTS